MRRHHSCRLRRTRDRPGDRIFFGTVSSNRGHFERTLTVMEQIEHQFPGQLARIITGRLPVERFDEAFDRTIIKNVLTFV